ncbi:MAG: DUF4339 domain-containing protein [Bdellovibrionaceae bacterium]|nr:DUF4339 domain-containing protein [Pseudobdellovibrionaceae bacterium]
MDTLKGFGKGKDADRDIDWVALVQDPEGGWIPKGPYSTTEVCALMKQGALKPTDYCWRQGWKDWRRIYEESSFYHSRKPPIDIKTVKKETIEFIEEKPVKYRAEIAETLKPQTAAPPTRKKNKDQMLEPWESVRGLDFIEDPKDALLGDSAPPAELAPDSLKRTRVSVEEDIEVQPQTSLLQRRSTYVLLGLALSLALILDFKYNGLIKQWMLGPEMNLKVSYITVQDYSLETPRHLMVRTDLKVKEKLVVRLLDMDEKPIFTIKGGAGLIIPSKGSGSMRIPLYPYDLKPGSYKVWAQAEGAEVVKAFVIPDPNAPTAEMPEEDTSVLAPPSKSSGLGMNKSSMFFAHHQLVFSEAQ